MHLLEVVNVEQLGNETSIAFDVGSELWTAKWPGQWSIHVGQKVPVQILLENLLFFDSETGDLIQSAMKDQRTRGFVHMSMTKHQLEIIETWVYIDLDQVKKKQRINSFFKGMAIFITIYYFI